MQNKNLRSEKTKGSWGRDPLILINANFFASGTEAGGRVLTQCVHTDIVTRVRCDPDLFLGPRASPFTHPIPFCSLVERVGPDLDVRAEDNGHNVQELPVLGLVLQPGRKREKTNFKIRICGYYRLSALVERGY